MISLIVAMDSNGVIGKNNQLPWHLPADLKYFKEVTTNHPIVMGRKTRDSIGRNLPNRENVIITRDRNYECDGCTILHSIDELKVWSKSHNDKEIFIIGGAEIFKETMDIIDRLYITLIEEEFDGDTYFPTVDLEKWNLIKKQKGIQDSKNTYNYNFYIYDRDLKKD